MFNASKFLVAGRLSHGHCGEKVRKLPKPFEKPSITFHKLFLFPKQPSISAFT